MISTVLSELTFRQTDTPSGRAQKLEVLKNALTLDAQRSLYVSITDGLPTAHPAAPLLRYRVEQNWTLGVAIGDAAIAATGTAVFPVKKNGVANGNISFTGTVATDAITSHIYLVGSLFELYPPATADATLDNISISIPLTVT